MSTDGSMFSMEHQACEWLMLLTIVLPLFATAACSRRGRGFLTWALALAPIPAALLSAAVLTWRCQPGVLLDPSGLQVGLVIDNLRAMLLGAVAILWILAGIYTASYLRRDAALPRFAVFWFLTMAGCLGVFLAADLAVFYFLFGLMSLSAYGMVVHDRTGEALRAAGVYLLLAVVGEVFLLVAFILLAAGAPGQSLSIAWVVGHLPDSPYVIQTMVFLLLGFGLKMGLVPLHGWLPIAHPAAPMPASAVLSGAIIKTGVLGLAIFLPWHQASPGAGPALVALGLGTAFWGVLAGITQANPKTVLAYSSVSQMGLVAATLGAGLWTGNAAAAAIAAVVYAIHHVFVKGALFLGVGVVSATAQQRRLPVLIVCSLLGLSFAALPFTGGYLAKSGIKTFFIEGPLPFLITLSSAASATLMLHLVGRLRALPEPDALPGRAGAGMLWAWVMCACLAVIVPWSLAISHAWDLAGGLRDPQKLWESMWPIGLGAGLAVLVHALLKSRTAPLIPPGDMLLPIERLVRWVWRRIVVHPEPIGAQGGNWFAAGVALVTVMIVLAALLVLQGCSSPRNDRAMPRERISPDHEATLPLR